MLESTPTKLDPGGVYVAPMPDSTPGREDDGTFTPEVDDDEILDAVAELEPAGTVDVGEAVGLARQNADYRLRQLRDEGRVESVKIGGALVWSTASTEQGDTDSEDGRRPGGKEEAQPAALGSGVDVEGLTFKRELTPERREALEAWLRYVREEDGGVTKSDFQDWWSDDRAAGTGYSKPGSFWEAFAKAAMKESEKFHKPNVRTYRWAGSE